MEPEVLADAALVSCLGFFVFASLAATAQQEPGPARLLLVAAMVLMLSCMITTGSLAVVTQLVTSLAGLISSAWLLGQAGGDPMVCGVLRPATQAQEAAVPSEALSGAPDVATCSEHQQSQSSQPLSACCSSALHGVKQPGSQHTGLATLNEARAHETTPVSPRMVHLGAQLSDGLHKRGQQPTYYSSASSTTSSMLSGGQDGGPDGPQVSTTPPLTRAQALQLAEQQLAAQGVMPRLDAGLYAGLPLVVFGDILSQLEPQDIKHVRLACSEWRRMCNIALSNLAPLALDSARLMATFPNLQSLDLSRCTQGVRASAVKRLVRGLKELSSLHLGSATDGAPPTLTDRWLRELASCGATNLRTLGLAQGVHISDQGLIVLTQMTGLTAVDLSGCVSVHDVGIMLLMQLPRLATLNLSWCLKLSNCGLKALASRADSLTSLHVSGCPLLTEAGLASLGRLTNLKSLEASHLGLAEPAVTDAAIACWSGLTGLTSLSIGSMQAGLGEVTDTGLHILAANHPHLASLHLLALDLVTDEGLLAVTSELSRTLTSLHVRSCGSVTAAALPGLTSLPHLRDLDLLNCSHLQLNAVAVRGMLRPRPPGAGSWVIGLGGSVGASTDSVSSVGSHDSHYVGLAEAGSWQGFNPPDVDASVLVRRRTNPAATSAAGESDKHGANDTSASQPGEGGSTAGQDDAPLPPCPYSLQSLVLGSWPQLPPGPHRESQLDDMCLGELADAGAMADMRTLGLSLFVGSLSGGAATRALTAMTGLASLELHACPRLGDSGLRALAAAPCAASLTCLSISKASPLVTPAGLLDVFTRCTALRTLNLRSCGTAVTDRVLDAAVERLRGLTALHVSHAPSLTDVGTARLLQLSCLQTLELSFCGRVTCVGFGSTPHHLPTLPAAPEDMLNGTQPAAEQAPAQRHPRLRSVSLSCTGIEGRGLAELVAAAPCLTHLDLSQCASITDDALDALPGLQQLISLDLSQCSRIGDQSLGQVAQLGALATLRLNGCVRVSDAGIALLGAAVSAWRDFLLTLHVDKCILLTDAALHTLANVTSLTSLRLALCPEVTDYGVLALSRLTRLSTLSLAHCPRVTEAGLAVIASLTSLANLEF